MTRACWHWVSLLGSSWLPSPFDNPQVHQEAGAGAGHTAQLTGICKLGEAGAGTIVPGIAAGGQEVDGDFEKLLPGDGGVRAEGAVGETVYKPQVIGLGDGGSSISVKGLSSTRKNRVGMKRQVGFHGHIAHFSPGDGEDHIPAQETLWDEGQLIHGLDFLLGPGAEVGGTSPGGWSVWTKSRRTGICRPGKTWPGLVRRWCCPGDPGSRRFLAPRPGLPFGRWIPWPRRSRRRHRQKPARGAPCTSVGSPVTWRNRAVNTKNSCRVRSRSGRKVPSP